MSNDLTTRRAALFSGLTATGLLSLLSDAAFAAPSQDEVDIPFTDYPPYFNPTNPKSQTRLLDIRKIDGMFTPKEQFFAVNHFDRPVLDATTFRLKFTGLLHKPAEFLVADLRAMKSTEVAAGFECSGNGGRSMQGLSSCGKFTGVRLATVLKQLGVDARAREVVFFGADHGPQDVVFRQETFKLDQQFGRSMTLEHALKPEPLLAYALNGDPLTKEQGFPIRLIMPGWYGVANVKWLAEVHLQEDRYLGNYQARWYRTLRGEGGTGEESDSQTQWVENEITHMQLKSVIARVRKSGESHLVSGFVLNDGTPLKSVEVKIDNGSWQKAALDPANSTYSWKRFTYRWEGATPGEHTLVSRATDANGTVQPAASELARKKTFLEDNSQFPRTLSL